MDNAITLPPNQALTPGGAAMGLGQPDLALDGGYEPKPGFHRAFGKEGSLARGHRRP